MRAPALLDMLEAHADQLEDVHIYQMCTESVRPYEMGEYPGKLTHHEFFLGGGSHKGHANGTSELYPVNFSMIPELVRDHNKPDILIASVSEPDEHGYMSIGLGADYSVQFIGKLPIFGEINAKVPHSFGQNQIHARQMVGATRSDAPVLEGPPPLPAEGSAEHRIAELIAPEIKDRDCLQLGIGKLPNAILTMLKDRKDLGVHTELMSDGVMDLLGQAASETIAGRFYSGAGGQLDFAIGVRRSEGGRGYIVCPSVTRDGASRIKVELGPNSPVTTHKNYIDNVVTEHGIARLRGTDYSTRARRLIEVAHPDHREDLYRRARELNIVSRLAE
ncbi:acetyl-CoA hydrolase/transferase family protein [Corynebacterium freneyi]|uniref:acetyl-CoA hydrolase/transferase family protein n=1 Tax=Corynebacterium freneyi TaxID=134034 RepID=UPI00396C43D8